MVQMVSKHHKYMFIICLNDIVTVSLQCTVAIFSTLKNSPFLNNRVIVHMD